MCAGHREQVHAELVHPGRHLAHRLGGVRVQEHAGLARDARDLGDRLDGPDLVVGVHHRDEHRPRRERPGDVVGVDQAGPVDRYVGHVCAVPLEVAAGLDDRRVLHRGGHDVRPLPARRLDCSDERGVVRLGTAAGEDDLGRRAAEEPGEPGAGAGDGLSRRRPRPVRARGVAVVLREVRQHRLEHLGGDGRAGVVVQVDHNRDCTPCDRRSFPRAGGGVALG